MIRRRTFFSSALAFLVGEPLKRQNLRVTVGNSIEVPSPWGLSPVSKTADGRFVARTALGEMRFGPDGLEINTRAGARLILRNDGTGTIEASELRVT